MAEPPRITSSFTEISANVSLNLSVSCTADGTLPLLWLWRHDTLTVNQSELVSYETAGHTSTLTFSSLEEEDGGVYQCVVLQPSTGRQHAHNQLIEAKGTSSYK